jgi:uncharacterized repeat protein (TIGR01451 family)
MTNPESDSASFEALSRELLNSGLSLRFEARGASMSPCIRDGQIVHVTAVIVSKLRKGDIVLTKGHSGFRVHRLVVVDHSKNLFITRGDCGLQNDPPVRGDQILGIVVAKEVKLGKKFVRTNLKGIGGKLLQAAARGQSVVTKLLRAARLFPPSPGNRSCLAVLSLFLFMLAAPSAKGQVAVDSTSSTSADLVGAGTETLTFAHTTTATANRVLLVSVSMDVAKAPTTGVVSVTYNGTGLTFLGAQNDAANTRRVEIWYLLAPANGTFNVVVSVNIPAAVTEGVVAGATTFTDVDQTVPLSSFVSSDGEAAAYSQLNVPSVVNGMVFDTVAVGMGTITVNGPQVTQWNTTTGGATPNAAQEIVSTATTRTGAPSVPLSESFNETLTLTSVVPDALAFNLTSVAPTTVTLALTAAANAAGGDTVYTGTITGGAGNAFVGDSVVVAGFTNGKDNGTFTCTASTATTITLNNAAGVAQAHAATATVTTSTVYTGTITGGAGNAFAGDTVVVTGFVNAANNGTFTVTASTATTLTLNNKASIAETDPGTATVSTATSTSTVYIGTITGGTGNGFAGDTFTVAGFTNAGNNGTFTCTASTATALTCTNAAGVKETDPGTAATSSTLNWSEGAVSINPSTADIAVTTSVGSAVFLGSPTTYTITVTNNGPSAANAVKLTDTLAAGMTLGTVSASAGTACTGTGPITCTLPTPFASGAVATIIVPETATASGSYANTATITDSGTPPDPNTGNNTFVAVATVQSVSCANVTQAAPGNNLTGVLNTYYPGKASVAAGATSITVGAATGAGSAIAAGNLLLVIQMQDASINDSNTVAYGNGYTGQGFTALNSAGDYEFVTAQSAVATTGGALTISGAGLGGGLVFPYHSSAASATAGQSTFQVIVVPQYSTASFSAATPPTALAWNGSTGGVLSLDTSDTLTLNGATVSVSGLGFRGGAGMQLTGGGGANTDYHQPAPATYTGAAGGEPGWDANKGEGIAGTPMWVESNQTFLQTTTTVGYPSGTAGTDGSMARGAPGNAGGGGTDGDPQTASPGGNDQNDGGGGGGNGGAGGFGGDSWNTNLSLGGEGGTPFPATINRIALGGGGGAGTRNNSDGDNQASGGAAGGGIVIIRTYLLSGTATLTANGASAYNLTANDAGGGGGAGGSIVVLSANGGESGLTLQANGGNGGNAWETEPYTLANRHGPGGGGGGGVVLISGTPASVSVAGGASGLTENPGVPYGSTAGTAGTSVTNASITQTSGTQSGAQCTPDMTLAKSHVGGNFTRGSTATYIIPVENLSPYGPTSGTVTVNDTLPVGLTPTNATGTNWTCSIASQTVSCINSTVLAPDTFYPSITVTANVLQTAPSTETNTALVSGGGEVNLANDSATDVANVVSIADLSITNTASPNPVTAGSNITYTQVLTNNGPSAADNTALVEAVPTNTTFVSIAAPAGWTCTTPPVGSTGNVVCTDLSMAGGTAATFSLITKVNTGTANGTVITDTASASSSVSDPNSGNNTASASTIVGASAGAELTVTNAASPNGVAAGGNITYTQIVTNVGTLTATTASLTETVTPAPDVTFVSVSAAAAPGWTCTGPPVSCTNPAVAAGATATFTVVYQVNAGTSVGTTINNTATVTATNQTSGPSIAVASDTVTASTSQADLALSTASTPLAVYAGNDITYIQTITNSGPSAATTVSFLEAVPTNATFASVSAPAGWTCTSPAVGATGNVTCTDPSLAANTSAAIIVVVNVAPSITATPITATSSVSAANSLTSSTTTTTPVATACDLAVTDSGAPSPVTAGANITYTQVVTNSGPSNCSTATFTESIPANTTFVSLTPVPAGWTCTTAGSISCSNPSVAPGSTSTFPVVVTVAAGTAANTIITDIDTVTTTTHDTNLNNNTAAVSIAVASATQADLSVTNSASPNPVIAGSNITYTQTVTNGGPASATAVSFTETLPANTTSVSLSGPGTWSCNLGSLTCTIASLTANSTATFTLVLKVNTNTASGSTITQTDSVSSATSDPNPGNNNASTSVQVADSADLSVTNTASPVPVQAGNNITYTQVVTNAGPSTATSASLTETTPANTTYQSIVVAAGWSCITPVVGGTGTITCTNPSFTAGSASFTVVLQVTAGTTAGTAINNTAIVNSSTSDPNPGNNAASAADVVATATQADLITTNTASPTSVAAGSNVTYTQSVTNNGPAAATTVSFTQTTPPNTNFQSITVPGGWTCTNPAVGAAGVITCTIGTLAVNATGNFTVVLQVNAGTASGTNIAETAKATATNIVPNLTSNTAIATVVVANANSANVTIVKTATPSPNVPSGDTLTYTLTVTNNGPASATDVTVTDPLPTDVMYLSVNTTVGTCSEADGTVTCLLGTMANASTATVTILTLAGAPGTATNTASVIADQMTSPNTSTQVETITAATSIKLESFAAQLGRDKTGAARVVLLWKTGGEVHNLGFNVYREQSGERVQLNPSLIAGSALLMSGALPKHSGKTYTWIDSSTGAGTGSYWLEDVDVNGTRALHGPISATSSTSTQVAGDATPASSAMLNQLNQARPAPTFPELSHRVESISLNTRPTLAQHVKQFDIAAHSAVKIFAKHEGWYRVTQPELIAAGLDPNVDPALLHLYAEAIEQPMQISGASAGPGGFGPQAEIYFYGTGIDTQYSGTRVYFLTTGQSPGERIQQLPPSTGSNQPPASFPFTVELTPHTTYFSALTTAKGNNFFGPLISSTPVDETIQVSHLDATSAEPAQVDVILQGVILAVPHDVAITLNGATLGDLTFTGQAKGRFHVTIPPGLLQGGTNTITFTSQDGEYDYSLVQSIHVTYPHLYTADSDELIFTGRPGDQLKLTGFSQASVAVLDITDPNQPIQLTPQVKAVPASNTDYAVEVQVPWSTTNPAAPAQHTLMAVAAAQVASAAGIRQNHPSHWHSAQPGSEIVMVSAEAFAGALAPVLRAHQAEGKSSAIVLVDELYDEFNFGQHSPLAIRDFLQTAVKVWHTPPHFLLLNGRASLDPRNYLGFGYLDFVPTKIIPTTGLMTASDDWFSDFNDSGLPTIATGRLPVSTVAEAELVAGKVATYEGQSTNGPWTAQALMVADMLDTENFTKYSLVVQAQLPSSIQATDVFLSDMSIPQAQQAILNSINSGQLLVNYSGHGSEDEWSGDNLFNGTEASTLTNGSSLPVFLIMDCLNGFFQDVYEEPLAVSLMLAPNGGAVAVLASSGLNQATPQTILDKLVVQAATGPAQLALGDAILKAKSGITDLAVRKTYNLLGDPAMKIKPPVASPAP